MKAERTTSSYILIIGILSLLVVGSFVAYQVYAAVIKSQITAEQERAIKPLSGKIKKEVVEELRSRRHFGIAELNQKLNFGEVVEEKNEEVQGLVGEESKEKTATDSGEALDSSQEATVTGKVEGEDGN